MMHILFFFSVEDGLKNLGSDVNKVEDDNQESKSIKYWAEKSKSNFPLIFFCITKF